MSAFLFSSDTSAFLDASRFRLAEVPPDLSDKAELLAWYKRTLGFPEYFGGNWDAFEECLRDLPSLDERSVVLYHRSLPLKGRSKDQGTYLDILASVVEDRRSRSGHELVAAFDPSCEHTVSLVLASR